MRFAWSRTRTLSLALSLSTLVTVAARSQESTPLQDLLNGAAAAEQARQYEQAASLYERALASPALSGQVPGVAIEARTRLATDYYLLHRYQDSLNSLPNDDRKTSSSESWPAQAWLVAGLDRLELGEVPEAENALRKTLELNPDSGTARLALGDALARAGRMADAALEYAEQTRRTPSQPDAWYKLGLAYAQLSTAVAQDFANRRPSDPVGQLLLAEGLVDQGDDLSAARALFRLLHADPKQLQANADLGAALLELGYPKAAEGRFQKELAANPDCPSAELGLAETASLRGDWTAVNSSLGRLHRTAPGEFARLVELQAPGTLRDAWRRGTLTLPPSFSSSSIGGLWKAWLSGADTLPDLGTETAGSSCARVAGKTAAAPGLWLPEACYRVLRARLIAKKELTLEERLKLPEAEFRLDHAEAARREAERLLRSQPSSGWGVYWLSQSYGALAQDCFAKVTAQKSDSARVHEMLAHYWAGRHYYPRAQSEYLAAVQLAPELPDLHLGLATVYMASSQWTEAEQELKRTLELAPASGLANYELGDAYVEQQRWDLALDPLRKAAQDPTLAAKARVELARAESENGDIGRAVEDLLPVLGEDRDGQVHYRLAELYRKLGDKEKMREALAAFRKLQQASLDAGQSELDELDREREAPANPAAPPGPP